jgi:hypothetical protein
MGNKRTLIQLGVSGAIAGAMLLAFVAVGGVGAGLAQGGGPNHGQSVRSVAMDQTMTCQNSNNTNVSNHGWCVRSAAHGGTTTTSTSTVTAGTSTGTSTHGKSKTHKSKTHKSKTNSKLKTHTKTHGKSHH